ncbi:hypothetical protein DAEQUDRAFT_450247 [Daedalea quercina L-15889]|uniref:Uncharacterized protein n=1 Tax=Daedalea quercina L-15889 TaxID=1314783 RepID=A0A165N3K2_9APHY|nr:hypothetical protein DAEQUDRAFT_450247 [Daedalea quercina L-15889]
MRYIIRFPACSLTELANAPRPLWLPCFAVCGALIVHLYLAHLPGHVRHCISLPASRMRARRPSPLAIHSLPTSADPKAPLTPHCSRATSCAPSVFCSCKLIGSTPRTGRLATRYSIRRYREALRTIARRRDARRTFEPSARGAGSLVQSSARGALAPYAVRADIFTRWSHPGRATYE